MRPLLIIVGLLLIAAGIWVLAGHATYQQTDTLAQVGPAKLTAIHQKVVPGWVGIVGVVAGGLIALSVFLKR